MKSKEQLETMRDQATKALNESLIRFHKAKKLVSQAEDDMIFQREIIRDADEQLKLIAYNHLTTIEDDVRDLDIADFKNRMPIVLQKLEELGTIKVKDPVQEWIDDNKSVLEKYPNHYMAVSRQDGVIIACVSQDEYSIKMRNLPQGMANYLTTFHTGKYTGLSKSFNKEKISNWLAANRSRLQKLQSFEDAAMIVAKECLHIRLPSELEIKAISKVLGANNAVKEAV